MRHDCLPRFAILPSMALPPVASATLESSVDKDSMKLAALDMSMSGSLRALADSSSGGSGYKL